MANPSENIEKENTENQKNPENQIDDFLDDDLDLGDLDLELKELEESVAPLAL